MTWPSLPVLVTALIAGCGGLAAVVQRRRLLASWSFFAGLVVLAAAAVLGDLARTAETIEAQASWSRLALLVEAFFPIWWVCFAVVYSRGDVRESIRRHFWQVGLALVLPVGLAFGFSDGLIWIVRGEEAGSEPLLVYGLAGRLLNVTLLAAAVVVLLHFERTFRAAVGTSRWRLKYVVLGVALIFGVRIYTLSQALLFSVVDFRLEVVETAALFLGCVLFAIALLREGFSGLEIYPSRTVLQSSLTVILAGLYLFLVGVLAQVVGRLGGLQAFPAQAFLILLGLVGLAILLLSDRLRAKLGQFVSRHFRRPRHDSRKVWLQTTERLSSQVDRAGLCAAAARMISETFDVLSVSVFVVENFGEQLARVVTTSPGREDNGEPDALPRIAGSAPLIEGLQAQAEPFDLEAVEEDWAGELKESIRSDFAHGGRRMVVPLRAGERLLGVIALADRVDGIPYSREERELLGAIGSHLAASLLNLRLNEDLLRAREIEAFQTVSTFFVHDMKNAANSLNLMLQNLPEHFDDPEFREDALRAIGKAVGRINQLTLRLSSLRGKLELHLEEGDLQAQIEETLDELPLRDGIELSRNLEELPALRFDREQIRTVLTNLVVNAQEAVGETGRVVVESALRDGSVVICVRDSGCGMDASFIENELYRPFRSTKSKGLGIGMFQSRMIVEAHQGSIQVDSVEGEGTTFRVSLPLE